MKFYEEKYFSEVYEEVRNSLVTYNSGYSIPEFDGEQLERLDECFENDMGDEYDADQLWDEIRFDNQTLIEIANGTENWKEQEFCRWDTDHWHFFTVENVDYEGGEDEEDELVEE